jgi:hypothetical protein
LSRGLLPIRGDNDVAVVAAAVAVAVAVAVVVVVAVVVDPWGSTGVFDTSSGLGGTQGVFNLGLRSNTCCGMIGV